MAATVPNHRLLAREHLAEATALADEGRLADCRASLSAAAAHAIGRLAADHRLEVASLSRAMAVLSLRGVLPFDARPLCRALLRDGAPGGGAGDEADTDALICGVQALVDLAAGVPGAAPRATGWQRWETIPVDDDEDGDEVARDPLPLRGTDWLRAVRRDRLRRRARRVRRVAATTAFAVGLGLLGLAWSDVVEGTEHRTPKADIGFFDSGS